MAMTKLQMAQNNVGSLVVLKPGEQQHIAGIITERGNFLPKERGKHTNTIQTQHPSYRSILSINLLSNANNYD